MGVDSFGVYAYALWLVDIGFLVSTFGATGVASRYLADCHQPDMLTAILRQWRPFSIVLPLICGIFAAAGAWLTGAQLGGGAFALIVCWGLTSGLWGMHTAALVGLQRFDLVFRGNVIAAFLMLLGAAFAPIETEPAPIFAVMALACAAASLVGLNPISQASSGPGAVIDSALRRHILLYSLNVWLTALMWSLVWSRGEIPIVRNVLGDAAVGNYAVSLTMYGGAVAGVMLAGEQVLPPKLLVTGAQTTSRRP